MQQKPLVNAQLTHPYKGVASTRSIIFMSNPNYADTKGNGLNSVSTLGLSREGILDSIHV